jgi:hypothetical protein
VRVPLARKSHQEPMPPLDGCSATQRPTGVVGVVGVWASVADEKRRQAARAEMKGLEGRRWSIGSSPWGTVLNVEACANFAAG